MGKWQADSSQTQKHKTQNLKRHATLTRNQKNVNQSMLFNFKCTKQKLNNQTRSADVKGIFTHYQCESKLT